MQNNTKEGTVRTRSLIGSQATIGVGFFNYLMHIINSKSFAIVKANKKFQNHN